MISLSEIKNQGYWTVDSEEFNNKVKAILYAQEKNLGTDSIQYHYNDQWWDQHDWSQEPVENLDDLYVKRAKQLRDQYETLILRFSGGADSLNILKTFVENNIKIDIVSVQLWKLGDPDNTIVPNNIEKELIAFPLLKELQSKGADFKVIVSDQSELFSVIADDPTWFLKFDTPRFTLTDIVAHRSCTTEEYQEYNKPSTCVIVGVDKPRVKVKHNKIWYFEIDDCFHSLHRTNESNMVQEPFYWTADMPEIPIKQSHEVKKFYKNNIELLAPAEDPTIRLCAATQKIRLVPIIYPRWFGHIDPSQESLPYYDMTKDALEWRKQNGLSAWSPRGMGTDRTMHLSPYYSTWQQGIELADSMIDRRFKRTNSIVIGGLFQGYSKKRWLGN
jgi:hypothetical protein